MKFATDILKCSSVALAAAVTFAAPLAAQHSDEPEVVRGQEPDAEDVAMTPLRDLNLARDEIPEVLQEAAMAPYASERLTDCDALTREIGRLTAVLGPDLDLEPDADGRLSVGDVAKAAVDSFIPFQGIIREVTGAADHRRKFQAAILAGAVRRGYLKGLGDQRGCAYPASPADVLVEVTDEDEVEGEITPDSL